MFTSYQRFLPFVFVVFFAVGLASCDDPIGSDGSDSGNAPGVPDIQQRNADVSYFESNYPAGPNDSNSDNYSNFNQHAAPLVLSGGAVVNTGAQLAGSFLSVAESESATERDGQWVWEYSQSYQGESVSIRLQAETTENDSVRWQMIINSDANDGQSFDDYLFMEGTVSQDGNDGTWKLYDYEPDQDPSPSYVYNWEIQSDSDRILDVTTYDEEGNWESKFDYNLNDSEHTMVIEENNDEPVNEVFWNTESGTGYIMEGDQQLCWNSDFQNVSCN